MLNKSPSYTTRKITIPAGGSVQIYRDAFFVACLEAQAPFRISFDGGPQTEFEAGLTYNPENGVRLVEVINTGASDNAVTMAFGRGSIQDSRLTLGASIATKVEAPNTFATGAPVSALDAATTELAVANSNRVEILIANDGAGKVYIGGDAAATAGQGLPLGPGASMVLTTAAAVYARNDSGGAVALAVAEMERA